MAKVAITVLVLRVLQLALSIGFLVFWIWACAAKFEIGGGAGEFFLGYFTSLVSLVVCVQGFWAFAKRHHLGEHRALYHNARWAIDLAVTSLWLGVILISILVPTSSDDPKKVLNRGGYSDDPQSPYPKATDPIVVVGMGSNITMLFSAITFFMTALLLVIPAIVARRKPCVPEQAAEESNEKTDEPRAAA